MTNIANISGNFLIAVPGLEDPNFNRSVVLVCEHSEEGAFGLVINRLLMSSIKPLLDQFEMDECRVDLPVHYGGPVRPDQGYILYEPLDPRYRSIRVSREIGLTASKEILLDIAAGRGPKRYLFLLGFAGWAAQQLERELMTDSWLVSPMDTEVLFHMPVGERWRSAAGLIGVDFNRLADRGGSA